MISGLGRSHMPQSNEACAPRVLKLHSLKQVLHNRRSRHSEKPKHHSEEQPLQHEGPKHRKRCAAVTAPGALPLHSELGGGNLCPLWGRGLAPPP